MSAPVTAPPGTEQAEVRCARCGRALGPDQEWCLECGAQRTTIQSAPDIRIAAAVVGTVVAMALIALAVVLVNLSSTTNRELTNSSSAARPTSTAASSPTSTAAGSAPSIVPPAGSGPASPAAPPSVQPAPTVTHPLAVASWPVGLSGWTVVLSPALSESRARARAQVAAAAGLGVGVLDTTQHPAMRPGAWIVFSGRYPGQAQAAAAALALRTQGHQRAAAVEVAPPGGL